MKKQFNYKELEVEANVPIPPKTSGRKTGSSVESLIKSMKVGDSVVVSDHGKYSYIYKKMRQMGIASTMRQNADGSIRIWRVKK